MLIRTVNHRHVRNTTGWRQHTTTIGPYVVSIERACGVAKNYLRIKPS